MPSETHGLISYIINSWINSMILIIIN
jgi:hypothetical protein